MIGIRRYARHDGTPRRIPQPFGAGRTKSRPNTRAWWSASYVYERDRKLARVRDGAQTPGLVSASGWQPDCTAKTIMSISPNQYTGIDTPNSVASETNNQTRSRGAVAATTPLTTPGNVASRVLIRRVATSLAAGRCSWPRTRSAPNPRSPRRAYQEAAILHIRPGPARADGVSR